MPNENRGFLDPDNHAVEFVTADRDRRAWITRYAIDKSIYANWFREMDIQKYLEIRMRQSAETRREISATLKDAGFFTRKINVYDEGNPELRYQGKLFNIVKARGTNDRSPISKDEYQSACSKMFFGLFKDPRAIKVTIDMAAKHFTEITGIKVI